MTLSDTQNTNVGLAVVYYLNRLKISMMTTMMMMNDDDDDDETS